MMISIGVEDDERAPKTMKMPAVLIDIASKLIDIAPKTIDMAKTINIAAMFIDMAAMFIVFDAVSIDIGPQTIGLRRMPMDCKCDGAKAINERRAGLRGLYCFETIPREIFGVQATWVNRSGANLHQSRAQGENELWELNVEK